MTNRPIPKKDQKLIERYIDLELSEVELVQFHQRMHTEANFNNWVQALENINQQFMQAIDSQYEKRFADLAQEIALYKQGELKPSITKQIQRKTKIKTLSDHISSRKTAAFNTASTNKKQGSIIMTIFKESYSLWWAKAASFALLISVSCYLLFVPSPFNATDVLATSERLLHQASTEGPLRGASNSNSIPKKEIIQKLYTAFQEKNYETVIQLAEKVKETPDILLFKGIAWYELKELEKAQLTFKKVINDNRGQKDIALWGLVSVSIALEQLEEAKDFLQQIAEGNYPTSKKAKKRL